MSKSPEELVKQGDKKLSSWLSFGNRWEDALELYVKASNLFKGAKNWEQAANVYLKIAQCNEKLDNAYDASSAYSDAANAFRKMSPPNLEESVRCFQASVEKLTEIGKFSSAAKLEKDIAEMLEKEGDTERAIGHYKQAADYFNSENTAKTSENNCYLQVAILSAKIKNYKESVELFEKVALNSLDNNLLKWSVREYLFKGMLCRLADTQSPDELPNVREAFERYKDMDPQFPGSREADLLESVLTSWEQKNVTTFTSALKKFDQISPLDPWKVDIFSVIKENIEKEDYT